MSYFEVKEIGHARDRDNRVILVGDYVCYEEDVTSQRVDKIVRNYGGNVLFLHNGLRTIAHECWLQDEEYIKVTGKRNELFRKTIR